MHPRIVNTFVCVMSCTIIIGYLKCMTIFFQFLIINTCIKCESFITISISVTNCCDDDYSYVLNSCTLHYVAL